MTQLVHRFGLNYAIFAGPFNRDLTSRDVSSFSAASFARFHRQSLQTDLTELVRACQRQLRFAFELLHPGARIPGHLECCRPMVLDRLTYSWDRLCTVYRAESFDSQLDFFDSHTLREVRRWRSFIERTCTAPFTTRPHWTRALLEAAEIVPILEHTDRVPVEELFGAIIATLEGKDHELAWLV